MGKTPELVIILNYEEPEFVCQMLGLIMLEKRVKRQVIARNHTFFIPTAPGLEKICAAQVHSLGLEPTITQEGGIECQGKLSDMYGLCLGLSLANRVLMRLTHFRASNFQNLEKSLRAFPWELYLSKNCVPNTRVTVHKSRLYHSRAIAERVNDSIAARLKKHGEISSEEGEGIHTQQVFVRGVSDRFTLSIDACGDLLHRRGVKETSQGASIRETLASAILKMAGYDGTVPLVDPMCGSGTFSTEAALIAGRIPPGWNRDFAFFTWPAFRKKQWLHLRSKQQEHFKHITKPTIFASDIKGSACENLAAVLRKRKLEHIVRVKNEDILSMAPPKDVPESGLVVVNPPYGLRLSTTKESFDLFKALCHRLSQQFSGWDLAILVPHPSWAPHVPIPNKTPRKILHHGGLKIPLYIGPL